MTRYVGPLLVIVLLAAGCGEATTRGTEPEPGPSPTGAGVEVVAEDDADLHLWVSNQSFVDDPVTITVAIDGVTVVDQEFDVEGQHNWQLFPVALGPGPHTIRVGSDTGTTLERAFRTPRDGRRHAVVDYWNYEDEHGRHFSWQIQRQPVAFA